MNRASSHIDAAHRRRWPDRKANFASRSWLLASSPGLWLLLMQRINYRLYLNRNDAAWRSRLCRLIAIPLAPLKFALKIITKSAVRKDIEIDDGVCFSDQGHILFGARKTGSGTVIGPRVTVGMKFADTERPEIGRNVWIGSDCVLYGTISIGNGATLLPGTVLTKSVPAGVVMAGNPARMVLQNFDNALLRERRDVDAIQYVNAQQGGG